MYWRVHTLWLDLLQEVPHWHLLLFCGRAEVFLVQHLQQDPQLAHQHLHGCKGQRPEATGFSVSVRRSKVTLTSLNKPTLERLYLFDFPLCPFIYCHFTVWPDHQRPLITEIPQGFWSVAGQTKQNGTWKKIVLFGNLKGKCFRSNSSQM